MPYTTDERLKGYLDSNQLHREQMCLAVLGTDRRFSDVRPRHPRGGRDGGRDIEAFTKDGLVVYGAVGFVNQVNDSNAQKRSIKKKFNEDVKSAIESDRKPDNFLFFTNLNLTVTEKNELTDNAKRSGFLSCEIFDRERIRIILDSPDGFSIRFQYLQLPLSEAEQSSFFARWGDDIQSVISTGFQSIEKTLKRLLFLQEASQMMSHLTIALELDKPYKGEDIGHFRAFCALQLREPKNNIYKIDFGSSDRSERMTKENYSEFLKQQSGIKNSICSGQWDSLIKGNKEIDDDEDCDLEEYKQSGWMRSAGQETVKFINISYSQRGFFRWSPKLKLEDIDNAMFVLSLNNKLAEKIKIIHVVANGYKLLEIDYKDFEIGKPNSEYDIPVQFTDCELEDKWVLLRPNALASAFHFNFFDQTPTRLFESQETVNSLKVRS